MSPSTPVIILNVDDNEVGRYAKSRALKAAGFIVYEAGTGEEALEVIRQVYPKLALIDVKLPDMDGVQLSRLIKNDPLLSRTLVLQTSATFVQGGDRVRALEGGADSYLVEPVEPGELLANINALLRLRQAEDKVRESERLLRLATSAAELITWSLTLSGRTAPTAETFAAHITQLATAQGNSTGIEGHLHPDDRQVLQDALEVVLKAPGQCAVEYRNLSDRGEVRWVACQGTVLVDAIGHPEQLIGVARDITERKRFDLERDRLLQAEQIARREAEEATRLKDEFLATVSHELRTPLNAITGWAHLLRSGKLRAEEMERGLETIQRNADSQSRLINDLLDVSRIISGKLHLEVNPVALHEVVQAAVETVNPAAQAKGVQIVSELDCELPAVAGDAERLQQVVWNLLTNAVKFSEKGSEIEVTLSRFGRYAELSVKDHGVGIAADFLPYVFHPFRQAEATTTRRHPGLGLGLAIVRHLVELHGGNVSAESAGEGQGATFKVRLPREAPAQDPSGGANEPQPQSSRPSPDLTGVRVLVVDDEADAREVVIRTLEQSGATVRGAGGAADARGLLFSEPFDALVCDIGMPGEDGYAFLRSIRALSPQTGSAIPAAALTAYARSEDRLRALAAGFQNHVVKPVQAEELLAVVAELTGRAHSN